MNIFSFLAILWVGIVSACTSHALTVEQGKTYSENNKIDLSARGELTTFICDKFGCPDHISVDQLKLNGAQVAEIHATIHYNF